MKSFSRPAASTCLTADQSNRPQHLSISPRRYWWQTDMNRLKASKVNLEESLLVRSASVCSNSSVVRGGATWAGEQVIIGLIYSELWDWRKKNWEPEPSMSHNGSGNCPVFGLLMNVIKPLILSHQTAVFVCVRACVRVCYLQSGSWSWYSENSLSLQSAL